MKHTGYFFKIKPKHPEFDNYFIKNKSVIVLNDIEKIKKEKLSKDIFVVHGQNDEVKEKVARFLGKLNLKPIILHEQPNAGRTIIEKFEDQSKVGLAVILMTPDDVGGKFGENSLKLRARQNVILEYAYFLGALGRKRVCVLYTEGVELPSDLFGILYIPLKEDSVWKFQLATEIKASGVEVDLNLVDI